MAVIEARAPVAAPLSAILEQEKALLHRVRLRDAEGAAAVLGGLLTSLRAAPAQARARVVELLALISRSVILAGGNEQAALDVSARYAEQVAGAPDIGSVCAVARAALREFMAILRPTPGGARHELLMRVMTYLRANYHRPDLSLDEIARVVHMSPAYLSHLFSKELNMTMTQYLTFVRLEVAMKLLRETDTPVTELALHLGYVDAGAFGKTFKKYLNISPGAYRQRFRAGGALPRIGGLARVLLPWSAMAEDGDREDLPWSTPSSGAGV